MDRRKLTLLFLVSLGVIFVSGSGSHLLLGFVVSFALPNIILASRSIKDVWKTRVLVFLVFGIFSALLNKFWVHVPSMDRYPGGIIIFATVPFVLIENLLYKLLEDFVLKRVWMNK